jgi:hypothetical protein
MGIDGCLIELGEALITERKIWRFAGDGLAPAGLAESGSPTIFYRRRRSIVYQPQTHDMLNNQTRG